MATISKTAIFSKSAASQASNGISAMTSLKMFQLSRFTLAIAPLLALAMPVAAQDTPEHVIGTNPYPYAMRDFRGFEDPEPPIELPDSVALKLALLSEEQVAFLESDDARPFTGDLEKTIERLEEITPEEVLAWVEAMQDLVSRTRYVEGRDDPNIALNVELHPKLTH
jgi:hypothetical protein